jgi:CRP/FNR family cyclic AMP-dependent transcriptional regulator
VPGLRLWHSEAVSASTHSHPTLCRVLEEDPELAEVIPGEQRAQAIETVLVRELALSPGVWRRPPPQDLENGLGMLVLEGILIHRVGVGERFGIELIGEGDLLQPPPWGGESTLPMTNRWLILEPSRVAVLDERFIRQLAQFPELAGRLVARAVQRSRQLAVNMAIVHQARVDVRLHLLLWHLASRWGRVRSDGVVVPLRLTHAVLSDLVAARRPTVTSALSDLGRRGLVRAVQEGWLLSGDPPDLVGPGLAASSTH